MGDRAEVLAYRERQLIRRDLFLGDGPGRATGRLSTNIASRRVDARASAASMASWIRCNFVAAISRQEDIYALYQNQNTLK